MPVDASPDDELNATPVNSGEYVVVARRYRPQNFAELIGQKQVSQALGNAIASNRVGHAYLFTGARGVGKTSAARIFAKALNCVEGPTASPCGQCDACQGIASGDDMDVIEIDGASNRGIDEIRQLRQNVNIRPSRSRFKIYIIDEVHMLTREAFNALLKTLEEPPEHAKFIFCTTEANKIPITVLSRCQRYDFLPLETKSILARLQSICQTEGVEAEVDALQILARRAAGSMRDSQSLLEQLLSFGGQRITASDVNSLLGTAKSSRLSAIADCVVRRDAAGSLREVDAALTEGVDLGQFMEQLLGHFRDLMAALVGAPPELLLHSSEAEYDQLASVGKQLGLETALAIIQILDQTLARMQRSTHVRSLCEIALVRICRLEELDQLPELISQLRGGQPASQGVARTIPNPVPAPRPQPATPAASSQPSPIPAAAEPLAPTPQKKTDVIPETPPITPHKGGDPSPLTVAAAEILWKQAIAELGDMTAATAAEYDSLAISGPNQLVVRFRKAYTRQVCERPDRKSRLEQALAKAAGYPIRLEFESAPQSPTPSVQRPTQPTATTRRQRFRDAEQNLLVRAAIEAFDGEVFNVIEPVRTEEGPTLGGEAG